MKMRGALFAVAAIAGLGIASPALAHHSFAAMYDAAKPIRLTGTLSKVEWTNPHSYFHLAVVDSKGNVSTWTCEGANPAALSRRGFKRGSLKIGDKVVVDGFLARSGARIVDARRITLADGRVVSGGTAGDGGPGESPPSVAPAN